MTESGSLFERGPRLSKGHGEKKKEERRKKTLERRKGNVERGKRVSKETSFVEIDFIFARQVPSFIECAFDCATTIGFGANFSR